MPIEITQLSHTYMPGSALAYPALADVSLTVRDGGIPRHHRTHRLR